MFSSSHRWTRTWDFCQLKQIAANTYTNATERDPVDGGDDSVCGFLFSVCSKPHWPMSGSPECLLLVNIITANIHVD
jgi:hypothetical protein